MSPAVDLFTTTEVLNVDSKSRCRIVAREAGGGGINVARNLHRMGAAVEALFPVGGYNGQRLLDLLAQEGVPARTITVANETTQNIALAEQATGKQFHLVFPGAELQVAEWQSLLAMIDELQPAPAYLVQSGSLPPGVPPEFSAQVATLAKARGIKVVLDAAGPSLLQASRAGVYLSKLNREDFVTLGYRGSDDMESRLAAMTRMVADGYAELLVLTLGAEGALLASRDGARLHAAPLPVEVVSHVGAGDAFVSMMTARLALGDNAAEALCYGVAAAAAAISTPGNQLRDLALVDSIRHKGLQVRDYGKA
jgi:6-phosphofructokinase 2